MRGPAAAPQSKAAVRAMTLEPKMDRSISRLSADFKQTMAGVSRSPRQRNKAVGETPVETHRNQWQKAEKAHFIPRMKIGVLRIGALPHLAFGEQLKAKTG
ncbi:hypothetical protein B0H19DRAFT_1066378 [Mycena capillaripes]|nr:hypothetical protein B0H19DRAFT_1066378 [Mycena capillaripes]